MDVDEDGVVNLDHVQKVIELLGTDHVRIPAKQIRQVIEMLAKEEMLEVEQKIEQLLKQPAGDQLDKPVDPSFPEKPASDSKSTSPGNDEHFEEETVPAKSQNNGGNPKK
jgi:hypothetical protein